MPCCVVHRASTSALAAVHPFTSTCTALQSREQACRVTAQAQAVSPPRVHMECAVEVAQMQSILPATHCQLVPCCCRCCCRSDTKFNSGCGWPAYYDNIEGAVDRHEDRAFGMVRTEITCSNCGAHLGHVFRVSGENGRERPDLIDQFFSQVFFQHFPSTDTLSVSSTRHGLRARRG
jgi:hypothetical protein